MSNKKIQDTKPEENVIAIPEDVRRKDYDDLIANGGWKKEGLGEVRTSDGIREKEGFLLYTRRRNLTALFDVFGKNTSSGGCQKPRKSRLLDAGSSSAMGYPKEKMNP